MSLMARDSRTDSAFELCPEGTFPAVCTTIIDYGHQKSQFLDKDGNQKIQEKVRIEWDVFHSDNPIDAPAVVGKEYTASLDARATLRRDLEAWRGKAFTDEELQGFYLGKLVGVPCILTIAHTEPNDKGNVYANIKSIGGLVRGMTPPQPFHETVVFDIEKSDCAMVEKFAPFIRDRIKAAEEWAHKQGAEKLANNAEGNFTGVPADMVPLGDEDGPLPF